MKLKCPKCDNVGFSYIPISMSNNDFWNPIVCDSCGTIVGQMPSTDEMDVIKNTEKIPTIIEELNIIKSLLFAFEKRFL